MATPTDYEYKYEKFDSFSYFDLFGTYEIDLTEYLKNFSSSDYALKLSNSQPVKTTVKNLFAQYELKYSFKDNPSNFTKYKIQEGEKVEDVSQWVYGKVDHWWMIFMFNNITEPFKQWPLTGDQIAALADVMYEKEGKYPRDVYQRILFDENEKKRTIVLPSAGTIADVINNFRDILIKEANRA